MNLRLRRGWRKVLWQRLNNPQGKTRPVFIVGCGRSGTSMLLHRLGRSRSVDPYNENNEDAFVKWRLRPLDVIEQLVRNSYARVILFKPVLTTPHCDEYLTRFPDARLVFVFRHYSDVINSSLKRFGPADRLAHVNDWIKDDFSEFAPISPPEKSKALVQRLWKPSLSPESAAALYWLFHNTIYFDLGLDKHVRVKLVNYESLVANAAAEIGDICAFLDLKFEAAMAADIYASSVGRSDSRPMDLEIAEACESLWQQLQTSLQGPDLPGISA